MAGLAHWRKGAARGLELAALLAFVAPLLTRLAIGQAFFLTGRGKLENPERIVEFFTGLGIPMPALNAAFVSRLEYYGGMLLIVGLATRLCALLLSSTMVVALMTADKPDFLNALTGAGEKGLTEVTAFVYLLFLLWLVFLGPGALSVDALLRRALGIEPAPPPGAAAGSGPAPA